MATKKASAATAPIVTEDSKKQLVSRLMGASGYVYPDGTLFFRVNVGEATDPKTGTTYELTTNVADGAPIIHSSKTGKWFTMTWQQLIETAIDAGIDR